MSIVPVGGWTDLARDVNPGTLEAKALDGCPICHSNDWKSASMVFQEGTSVSRSRTKGRTVGIARAGFRNGTTIVGGGIYQGNTVGVSQTLLSEKATPPQMSSGLITFLALVSLIPLCVALVQGLDGHIAVLVMNGSLAGVLAISAVWVYEVRRSAYRAAMDIYADTRMCLRCGDLYPGNGVRTLQGRPRGSHSSRYAILAGLVVIFFVSALVQAQHHSDSHAENAQIVDGPSHAQTMSNALSESINSKTSTLEADSAPPAPEAAAPTSSEETNVFKWSTVGLPVYVTYALTTPSVLPAPGHRIDLNLGPVGTVQTLFRESGVAETDSENGPLWHITEPNTPNALLNGHGAVFLTMQRTNGYHNLLVADKTKLGVFEYHDGVYSVTRCFVRGEDSDSTTREIPCQQ